MKNCFIILVCFFAFACSNQQEKENKTTAKDSVPDSSQKETQRDAYNPSDKIFNQDSIDASGIEFGFMNKTGSQILIVADSIRDPKKFTRVLNPDQGVIPISFIKKQRATAVDNGRQNEFNFDNCAGYLYSLKNETGDQDGNSVAILTENFLSDWQLIDPKAPKPNQLSPSVKSRVEKMKGRKIKNYKCLAAIDKDRCVYIFEFELKKNSALASLIYITPDQLTCKDYPATYDETSTWRVDDGGNFGVDYFNLLALFEKKGKVQLIIDWPGAESVVTEYMHEDGTTFNTLKSVSRYIAPQ